jgi:hypothetical protein
MPDDRAYVLAMAAYALALKRRVDLVNKPQQAEHQIGSLMAMARSPLLGRNRKQLHTYGDSHNHAKRDSHSIRSIR